MEGDHPQGCVMWRGLSLGWNRAAELDLMDALTEFPNDLEVEVVWMMTPTLKGVNVDAIDKAHSKILKRAKWYDDQGHTLFQCMEKHLGHTFEGLPFMARGVHGIWGPPPSCPYSTTICIGDVQTRAGWTLLTLRKGA